MRLLDVESALLTLSEPPVGSSDLLQAACAADAEKAIKAAGVVCMISDDKKRIEVIESRIVTMDELDVLALAASCLHAYIQANFTGPALSVSPLALISANTLSSDELNEVAIEELGSCGEPVYHLSNQSAFMVVALQLLGLLQPAQGAPNRTWNLESVKIWRLRAAFVWIRTLDEAVPLPNWIVEDAKKLRGHLEQSDDDRAHLTLLLGQLAFHMSRSFSQSSSQRDASQYARQAADESGLHWRLTGHLGKRTKFQLEDKTQLVVLAKDAAKRSDANGSAKLPEALSLNDDTLLERTAFTDINDEAKDFGVDPSSQPVLEPFSQAALLALSLATLPQITSLVHLSSDVLTTSQIIAFVARVLEQPQNWSVHSMALLLRSRAEAGRSRTVERGVLQMQALVDQLRDGTAQVSAISSAIKPKDMAPARERLSEFHSLLLPPSWEMERELALRYVNLGVTKSALDIFTRLEMWEDAARCWNTLHRPDRGIEIIKSLLEGRQVESEQTMLQRKRADGAATVWRGGAKREAKLWCTLGELEGNPAHFEKAWEVSKHTSSRAMRSLGASYWAKQDFAKASDALARALRINPLFHRSWFLLGCCDMRLERWQEAQDAFTRCISLEDEDAEAWSNLASCHLRRGEIEGDVGQASGESASADLDDDDHGEAVQRLPFSRKRAAFECLRQAVKHSYDQWRVWYNYMIVAVDVGEMSEACRAQTRIVEIRADRTGAEAVDLGVLERLVDAVTRVHETRDSEAAEPGHVDPNVGRGLEPRVRRLIAEKILVAVPSFSQVHKLDARLAFWRGDFERALESQLKAYRTSVAMDESKIENDEKAFLEGCSALRAAVDALENFGPKEKADGSLIAKDWKFQARSLVRSFLGKTKDAFEDHAEYESLREVLAELK